VHNCPHRPAGSMGTNRMRVSLPAERIMGYGGEGAKPEAPKPKPLGKPKDQPKPAPKS